MSNRHHDLIGVLVVDPRERELPPIGILTVEDSETGQQMQIDTGRRSVREHFRELAARKLDAIRKNLRMSGVDVLELNTGRPYMPALRQFFDRREKRRS
jgi:uncharacterized protein (DUF58 family)